MPYVKIPRLTQSELDQIERVLTSRGWNRAAPTNKFEALRLYPPGRGFPVVVYFSKKNQSSLPDWTVELARGSLMGLLEPQGSPWAAERRIGNRIYPAGMLTAEELKAVDRHHLPEGVRKAGA